MKPKIVLCLLATAFAAFCFSGCASMGSNSSVSLLSASGFRAIAPETPKQQAMYASLTPYEMQSGMINGRTLYGYKDEKAGVVYVGDETQYGTYQRLLAERRIATQKRAAQMNSSAMGYYSSLGPLRHAARTH